MANLMDVREVLLGYFGFHNAFRTDLEIIETYAALPKEKRKANLALFEAWFQHHLNMNAEHEKIEGEYYFPHAEKYLKDNGGFVKYMKEDADVVVKLANEVKKAFTQAGNDTELLQHLQEYVSAVRKRLDDEEAIYVPMVMQNHTVASYRALEEAYIKTVSLKRAAVLMPWIYSKLAPEELPLAQQLMPWQVRLLINKILVPRYRRKYPIPTWWTPTKSRPLVRTK